MHFWVPRAYAHDFNAISSRWWLCKFLGKIGNWRNLVYHASQSLNLQSMTVDSGWLRADGRGRMAAADGWMAGGDGDHGRHRFIVAGWRATVRYEGVPIEKFWPDYLTRPPIVAIMNQKFFRSFMCDINSDVEEKRFVCLVTEVWGLSLWYLGSERGRQNSFLAWPRFFASLSNHDACAVNILGSNKKY